MIELIRKDIAGVPYALYSLGETADIRRGFEGLHGAVIEAGMGDRIVRLTDGRDVGTLAEWGTMPFEPTAKAFTVKMARGSDSPVAGFTIAGILWNSPEIRDLAKQADLVIDRGVLILRGDEDEPTAKTRFQPARSLAGGWAGVA